jgi:hypothetical protein
MENKNKEKRVIELQVMDELEDSGVSSIALVDEPAIEKYFIYMRDQKFVKPSSGESESDFMGRCVPAMIDEGKDQDQAVAMCISMYSEEMSYDTGALPPYVDQTGKKKRKFNEYGCPEATVDIELNLTNRQEAIEQANYGPLNPKEPNEEYWQAKADKFNTTIKDAKSATCGNCGFFVQTKPMLACIAAGIGEGTLADPYDAIQAGGLGYCEAFDFKCAAARTCDAWISGGPILEEEEFIEPNPCWEGYEAYGLKDDGTPNCVPIKAKKSTETKLAFAVEKDQQILVGPAMVPDMEILRRDEETGETYYVKFSKETIAKIQEKFMRETRLGSTNLDHNENVDGGSYVFESWIVEGENDKANSVYKLGLPDGSWAVKMRVSDPKVWEMVKEGKYQGFSIEGNFIDKVDYDKIQSEKDMIESIMGILAS